MSLTPRALLVGGFLTSGVSMVLGLVCLALVSANLSAYERPGSELSPAAEDAVVVVGLIAGVVFLVGLALAAVGFAWWLVRQARRRPAVQ